MDGIFAQKFKKNIVQEKMRKAVKQGRGARRGVAGKKQRIRD